MSIDVAAEYDAPAVDIDSIDDRGRVIVMTPQGADCDIAALIDDVRLFGMDGASQVRHRKAHRRGEILEVGKCAVGAEQNVHKAARRRKKGNVALCGMTVGAEDIEMDRMR